MGVASMDTFLQSLLIETQVDACIVLVVDNARIHADSWSNLPHRLRNNLTLKSDATQTTPPLTRRRNNQQVSESCDGSDSLEDPCPARWGTAANINNLKTQQQSALKPPAAPARQKSIEATPWVSMKNSPSSVLDSLPEDGPRMPKRQASVSLHSTDILPPPPMIIPPARSVPIGMSDHSETMLFSPDFSKNVKRSSASLLEDDDESEEEDCNTIRSTRSIRSY